jgi:hypothetical protein
VHLEVKECCIFSGCCLDRSKATLAKGDTDVAMLESSSAVKNLDGFENAITRLEQMSQRRPKMMESAPPREF